MKRRNTYRKEATKKFAAFLLTILFLSIPLVQTLHSHHADDFFDKTSTEESISSATEKCLICDYTAEIKGKQILLAHPPVISIPTNICATINTFVYTRIYKFTLQNFSNKGPPALLANFLF